MMQTTLLVLAAGMGSRYGGLKQMDPMGPSGETVLDYSVFDAIRAGFTKVVFVIRRDFADDFKQSVGSKFESKIAVEYVYQELTDLPEGFEVPEERIKPWGTTHAVLAAREVIDEPFAVINADDFYGRDGLEQAWKSLGSDSTEKGTEKYTLIAYRLENTLSDHGSVNRGVCRSVNGLLDSVEEHTDILIEEDGACRGDNLAGERVSVTLDTKVSMNLWGFPVSLMQHLTDAFTLFLKERGGEMKSECYIPTVVDELIAQGKVVCEVVPSASQWFGVTYPEDKDHVVSSIQDLVDQGDYPNNLWG